MAMQKVEEILSGMNRDEFYKISDELYDTYITDTKISSNDFFKGWGYKVHIYDPTIEYIKKNNAFDISPRKLCYPRYDINIDYYSAIRLKMKVSPGKKWSQWDWYVNKSKHEIIKYKQEALKKIKKGKKNGQSFIFNYDSFLYKIHKLLHSYELKHKVAGRRIKFVALDPTDEEYTPNNSVDRFTKFHGLEIEEFNPTDRCKCCQMQFNRGSGCIMIYVPGVFAKLLRYCTHCCECISDKYYENLCVACTKPYNKNHSDCNQTFSILNMPEVNKRIKEMRHILNQVPSQNSIEFGGLPKRERRIAVRDAISKFDNIKYPFARYNNITMKELITIKSLKVHTLVETERLFIMSYIEVRNQFVRRLPTKSEFIAEMDVFFDDKSKYFTISNNN